jgi:hypothetical protein
MHILSIVLLTVWLALFGAITATWITMSTHTFGVVTFIIGLAILIIELYVQNGEHHWFGRR